MLKNQRHGNAILKLKSGEKKQIQFMKDVPLI